MHESPIEMIVGQMKTEMENDLIHTVQKVTYKVDKDELIKALDYDRKQYQKGYNDGLNANKWISVKERMPEEKGDYLVTFIDGTVYVNHYDANKINWGWEKTTHWQPLPTPPEVK